MKYKKIKASKLIDENVEGIYPSRIVLLQIENKNHPFTSHLEVFPYDERNNGVPYVVHGVYCLTREDAEESFQNRMNRYMIEEDKNFIPDTEYQGN